jgi:large subunit ribosomal protein L31e
MERTYTIPLRKEFLKSPKYKRAKKSVIAVREFLSRHMRSDNVKLGRYLNLELWKHGINNPPSRVRVSVNKDDKGVVTAELVGAPVEQKVEAPKSVLEKVKEKVVGKRIRK